MTDQLPEPRGSFASPVHPVLGATACMREALASVAQVNPTFMRTETKAAALAEVAVVEAQLVELRMRILACADDVAAEAAARDVAGWFSHLTRTDPAVAKVEAALAVDLDRRWTQVADGMRTGKVSLAQARVVARALTALVPWVDPQVLAEAETALVALAQEHGPRQLAALGGRILAVVAPDVAEEVEGRRLAQEEAEVEDKVRATLRHHADGTVRLSAVMDKVTGTRLAVLLEAHTNPRKHQIDEPGSADEAGSADEGSLTSHSDPVRRLPHPRKLGRALRTLLEGLDPSRLPRQGGDQTLLQVTIDFDALCTKLGAGTILTTAAIPGGLVDGAPATRDRITASQVRRLACTAQILPVVLGGRSEILDLGRTRRLFSPAQQRALLLRDRTCRAEGCTIPGTWAEAHHWVPWGRFGRTDLEDGVLLCSHHHHCIHQEDTWSAERLPNGDVRFHRRR